MLASQLWMRLNRPDLPLEQAHIAVIGAPYDGSVTHARGAALAPVELRALSADCWPFSERGLDLRALRIRDLGDAPVDNDDPQATQEALRQAVRPVVQAGPSPWCWAATTASPAAWSPAWWASGPWACSGSTPTPI